MIAEQKARLRRTARAVRKAAAAATQDAGEVVARTAPDWIYRAISVGGYWPVGTELDSRPLMRWICHRGCLLALPHTGKEGVTLRFWPANAALTPDSLGVPAPNEKSSEMSPDIILVPLLAFDRQGRRLGQGGGHYDRLLARNPQAKAVGLAYAAQEVPLVPTEPHDRRLDWILTEREAIRVG